MNRKGILTAALLAIFVAGSATSADAQKKRMRDYGIEYGIFKPGKYNAITDVAGVTVGQVTLENEGDMHTGVTAIIPHQGNIFKNKVPAAIYLGNAFGKLAGYSQVKELGNIETPIVLTNTLSIAAGLNGLITYTLQQPGNEKVKSVNAVVGETNDGELNNIRARYVTPEHVLEAISKAKGGPVEEGCVGAGTGTVCFSWKGGIGTSSRVLPKSLGGYTVGVLVQTNYGGILEIAGVEVGKKLNSYSYRKSVEAEAKTEEAKKGDGSCMIVVATDAPVDARLLERIAKRAFMGLSRTGSFASNGSGDYIIAFSTYEDNFVKNGKETHNTVVLDNDEMSPVFEATVEATAEALWNSLFAAHTTKGIDGNVIEELPVEKVVKMIKKEKGLK
ncbi:MAG: P1 family peptidase [Candidatus Egerieousia sp.]